MKKYLIPLIITQFLFMIFQIRINERQEKINWLTYFDEDERTFEVLRDKGLRYYFNHREGEE